MDGRFEAEEPWAVYMALDEVLQSPA